MDIFQRHTKWVLFFAGCGVFVVFVFFSYLVHKNLFVSFDFNNTVHIQDHMGLRYVEPFSFLSDFGKVEIVSLILLVILAIWRKLRAFLAIAFFGLLHFIEIYGKVFVHHTPPPHFMLRTVNVINFPQFYVSTQNSYPSGHAGRAFFLTALLGVMTVKAKRLSSLQKGIIVAVLLGYDIVMGLSRVYLGEHWTSDVIGGSLLGLSCGLFASIFL
jgi:membrane-associated phospholipid phosphatase